MRRPACVKRNLESSFSTACHGFYLRDQACHSLLYGIGPASEPGPVQAERSDQREQASRREALTGGSDAAPWVRREWQAARQQGDIATLVAPLPKDSSARFALLPFAL